MGACIFWKKLLSCTPLVVSVLSAMVISSFGGKILNKTVAAYPEVAAYQPVINGVAGNLLSVQVRHFANVTTCQRMAFRIFQPK